MKRDQAINYLLKNNIFEPSSIGSPAMEFYIKDMETVDSVIDVDTHAHLNTLFGYDIGLDTALKIDAWLWDPDTNKMEIEFSALDLTFEDRKIVEKCVKALNLNLSFDKWRTEDFNYYEYYQK